MYYCRFWYRSITSDIAGKTPDSVCDTNGFTVERSRLLYYLLPAIQLILTVPIQYLDRTYNAQYILMIIAAGIINKLPMPSAKTYCDTVGMISDGSMVMEKPLERGCTGQKTRKSFFLFEYGV